MTTLWNDVLHSPKPMGSTPALPGLLRHFPLLAHQYSGRQNAEETHVAMRLFIETAVWSVSAVSLSPRNGKARD